MSARRASALASIETVARALAGERPVAVFVGGAVTAFYSLEGVIDVRPTLDVDCVVDLSTTAEYYAFVQRLRQRGFTDCTDENAPLCRLVYAGIRVDVVATVATGLGPTNRWYREAVLNSALHRLAEDLEVRVITPIFFVATKLEAFRGRGRGDYLASHDLEDILTVLAGLPALRDEIARGNADVSQALRAELNDFRAKEAFIDAVPAHFEGDAAGQARADEVLAWLATLPAG